MTVSCKVGRPRREADIDFSKDPDLELYDSFYRACRGLRYPEIIMLARTLHLNWRSVWNWTVGRNFPTTRGTAMLVIDWVNRGKPERTTTQAEIAASML